MNKDLRAFLACPLYFVGWVFDMCAMGTMALAILFILLGCVIAGDPFPNPDGDDGED